MKIVALIGRTKIETSDKQPDSLIHFCLMTQLSLDCMSLSVLLLLGPTESRSKVARAISEALILTQSRKS